MHESAWMNIGTLRKHDRRGGKAYRITKLGSINSNKIG